MSDKILSDKLLATITPQVSNKLLSDKFIREVIKQEKCSFFRSARASCTTSGEPVPVPVPGHPYVRNENLDPMYTGIYAS